MSTYSEKLKDPRWQKKRLEILERDRWACQSCADTETTLHVHHRWYEKGGEPWDSPNEALVTLCEDCHEEETTAMPQELVYLCNEVKRHFLASDVNVIMCGFHDLRLLHDPAYVASAIGWMLESEDAQRMLLEAYAAHLQQRRVDFEARKAGDQPA